MYRIGNKEFDNDLGLDALTEEIKTYLHEQQLVIVDEEGMSLTEEALTELLSSYSTYSFSVKNVSVIEDEFIEELITFIGKAEAHVDSLSTSNDKELIVTGFINLINSLLEIQLTAGYFNMEVVNVEFINTLAERAVAQIEEGDYDFLIDAMQYELIPSLVDFKNKLPERLH